MQKTTNSPFATPKINGEGQSTVLYILYTHIPTLCCSQAQQTLSRPHSVPALHNTTGKATDYNPAEGRCRCRCLWPKAEKNVHLATAGHVQTCCRFSAGCKKMNRIPTRGQIRRGGVWSLGLLHIETEAEVAPLCKSDGKRLLKVNQPNRKWFPKWMHIFTIHIFYCPIPSA